METYGNYYLGQYLVPNGYFGTTIAHVVYENGFLIHVFPHGFHKSPFLPMRFSSVAEAEWHILFHPNGAKYYH